MNFDQHLPEFLAARLQQPLPGSTEQIRYQPDLSYGRHFGPPPADARPAAVLALLYPHNDQWHLPLTLRPAHMLEHPGQISLPGGLIEPGERSQDAALRELTEELGVPADGIRLLGQLSEIYVFASNFRVAPWVAAAQARPEWRPNPAEVEQLLEVPLAHLLDPGNASTTVRQKQGVSFAAPCFTWQSHAVWGATCLILAELLSVVAEIGER